MKSALLLLCAGLVSFHVCAEELITNDCKAPNIPIPQASDVVVKFFNKRVETFKKCIEKFVDEQRSASKTTTDVTKANMAHDAAERATKQYNDFMAELNERNSHIDQEADEEAKATK